MIFLFNNFAFQNTQTIWEIQRKQTVLSIYRQMEQAMEIMKIHIDNIY